MPVYNPENGWLGEGDEGENRGMGGISWYGKAFTLWYGAVSVCKGHE